MVRTLDWDAGQMEEYERVKYYTSDHGENELVLSYLVDGIEINLPYSRKQRGIYQLELPKQPWPRQISKTYQTNQVGSFAGIFDKPINSTIRAGNSVLTIEEFVHFPKTAVKSIKLMYTNMQHCLRLKKSNL